MILIGDRANIVLRDRVWKSDPPVFKDVFLYTHWNGYEVEQIAADGLREAIKCGRVDDPQYGGRIVTGVFLDAHKDSPHTGAGVSAIVGDGESHMVTIDFQEQTVTYQRIDDPETQTAEYGGGTVVTVPVTEFVALFPAKASVEA